MQGVARMLSSGSRDSLEVIDLEKEGVEAKKKKKKSKKEVGEATAEPEAPGADNNGSDESVDETNDEQLVPPEGDIKMINVVKTLQGQSDGEQSAVSEVLKKLSASALRHSDVYAIRSGSNSSSVQATEDDEPTVTTRAEAKAWQAWAKMKARLYADTTHPRKKVAEGSAVPLTMRCTAAELSEAMGSIVPALYLDFLKFMGGYCALGALISVPSFAMSTIHASEVYSSSLLGAYPTLMLYFSIGARHECARRRMRVHACESDSLCVDARTCECK